MKLTKSRFQKIISHKGKQTRKKHRHSQNKNTYTNINTMRNRKQFNLKNTSLKRV
jgi:hypothetical protein